MGKKSSQTTAFTGFTPPAHLSPTSAALWRCVVPRRVQAGERLVVLVLALEALDLAEQCRRQLADTGLSVKSLAGRPCAHPLVRIRADARKEFASLWERLGLHQSDLDRTYGRPSPDDPGVGLPSPEEQDAMLREMKAENDALLERMLAEQSPTMET